MSRLPRLALVFDVFDRFPWRPDDPLDADAEFEPWSTVDALAAGVRAAGAEPVLVGTTDDLLRSLSTLDVDAGMSIAEGRDGVNREGHAPALFDLAGIPYLGSDALTMSLSLDKVWTNAVVAAAGVPVPPSLACARVEDIDTALAAGCVPPFPLFVKPRFEGSAKGITADSRVETLDALRHAVARITTTYRQDALVESFVEGSEFTVAVVGHDPPRALPPVQRAVDAETGIGLHALDARGSRWAGDATRAHALPGVHTPALDAELQRLALAVFETLRCRDFARMDFRVRPDGTPVFLEVNPLPTFAPDGTFAILAELEGVSYETYLGRILGEGLRRLGLTGRATPGVPWAAPDRPRP